MKPKALIDNLKGGSTGGKESGAAWGKSPRPSADQLPEWAREFQGSEWAATPNPKASKSKRERRARLLMTLMLGSLPVSLLSCLMSVALRPSAAPVAPPTDQIAQPAAPTVSKGREQARIVAQQWLAEGGVSPRAVIWQDFKQSHLSCAAQDASAGASGKCEEHFFRVRIDGQSKEWMRLTVTINPLTGTEVGVHMLAEESVPADDRPLWDRQQGSTAELESVRIGLEEDFDEAVAGWAESWTSGFTEEDNLEGEEKPWFGLNGWKVIPDSVSRLSTLQIGATTSYLVTVEFSVAQVCIDIDDLESAGSGYNPPLCEEECASTEDSDSGRETQTGSYREIDIPGSGSVKVCDSLLDITSDLHMAVDDRSEVAVEEYGAVGTLEPGLLSQQAQSAAV